MQNSFYCHWIGEVYSTCKNMKKADCNQNIRGKEKKIFVLNETNRSKCYDRDQTFSQMPVRIRYLPCL